MEGVAFGVLRPFIPEYSVKKNRVPTDLPASIFITTIRRLIVLK